MSEIIYGLPQSIAISAAVLYVFAFVKKACRRYACGKEE